MGERTLDVAPRALATLALSVAGVVVAFGAVRSIPRTLAAAAIATLLALGANPAVTALQRWTRAPRPAALAMLITGLVIVVAGLGAWLIPSAVDQARDLDRELPRVVRELEGLPIVGDDFADAGVPARVQRTIEELPSRLTGEDTPIVRVARSAADGVIAAFVTLLLAIALAADGPRLARLAHRALPVSVQGRASRAGEVAYGAVGRYVVGSLTVAAVAGLFALTVGLLLRIPLAPLLAMWIMVWNLVPQIGGAAGGVPFVALAFTRGALIGVLAAALFVVYLQLENNLLSPLLVGGAIKLSPPATMTTALIGVSAGGVVGALLAVPLAGAAKAVYLELRPPPRDGPDQADTGE